MKGKNAFPLKIVMFSLLCALFVGSIFIWSLLTLFKDAEAKRLQNETPIDGTHYTSFPSSSQENSEAIEINSSFENETSPLYTVKEYNGIIGVFNFEESKPFLTENKRIDNLPEKDREILKEGRDFYSYKDMVEFLMDYE